MGRATRWPSNLRPPSGATRPIAVQLRPSCHLGRECGHGEPATNHCERTATPRRCRPRHATPLCPRCRSTCGMGAMTVFWGIPAHKREGTRMKRVAEILTVSLIGGLLLLSAMAAADEACEGLPSHAALRGALATATAAEASGLNNNMWAAIVNRDGIVCAVAFSGANRGAQWPGSRVISAQKANTANAFSLDSSSFSNGSGQ